MGRRHYVPMGRHHDIPIRRREDVPLRRLGDVPLRRHWVFHLRHTCDVTGTERETPLRRCHDVLLPGGPISNNVYKKRLSGILLAKQFPNFLVSSFMALQISLFLVSSFIEDFLFISFQQQNEIKKGNAQMAFKYLLSCSRIDLFDVKDFKRNSTDGT